MEKEKASEEGREEKGGKEASYGRRREEENVGRRGV